MANIQTYGWSTPPNNIMSNYITKCELFSESDEHFSTFRQDKDYKYILEGYDMGGPLWLSMILERHDIDLIMDKLDLCKRNDIYGKPTIVNLPKVGDICPYTLKYIGNVLDITKKFKKTNFTKIVEVGIGFGSMCLMMDSLCTFDEYVLVDLPEVISLSKKYLSNFPELYKKLTFISCEQLNNIEKIDNVELFISDSALTECDVHTQINYFNKIIQNSLFGYIVYSTNFGIKDLIDNMFNADVENRQVNYYYMIKK